MAQTTTRPDVEAQVLALVAAQAAARQSLAAQAEAITLAAATTFRGWYDTAQITAWAAQVAQRVEALQRATAQTTDAYLARVLSALTGARVRPVGRVDVSGLRQGVTHAGAYARAADVYRWQQAELDRFARTLPELETPEPPTIVDPVEAAVERVRAVTDLDMQLADRAQTTEAYTQAAEKGTITGYRRVIHPERSAGGTCGLCVAASDRLYHPQELKPIHDRCKCTTLPVLDEQDVGSKLNEGDLERLYEEAGSTNRRDLKATRYRVDEHGELGPLLTKDGAPSRTARRARRDTNRKPHAPKSDAQKAAELQKVRDSLTPSLDKARELAKADPKKWGRYRDSLEARIADLDHQLAA